MGKWSGPHGHRKYAKDDMPCPSSAHSCWVCGLPEQFIGEPAMAVTLVHTLLSRPVTRAALVLGLAVTALGCLAAPAVVAGSLDGSTWEGQGAGPLGSHGGLSLSIPVLLCVALSVLVGVTGTVMIVRVALLPDSTVKEFSGVRDELTIAVSPAVTTHLADLLARAIQCQTISYDRHDPRESGYADMVDLRNLLERSFPEFHASEHVQREVIGEYSLLYTWTGTDPAAQPVIFCAHLDVVPAGDLSEWTHPPFGGTVDGDGVVWGRGAIDNKHNVRACGQLIHVHRVMSVSCGR
jgi:hypothetical protein